MLLRGTILKGFCGGYFGRDSYSDKRVEAVAFDWVVARDVDSGQAVFAGMSPGINIHEILEEFVSEQV